MTDSGDLDFLSKLGDPDASEPAWADFLRRYSPLLLRVARRFTANQEDTLDLYLHVCERLMTDDARRLNGFRGQGENEFSRWLAAVARNLCIDRLRADHGRRRLPTAILRLPQLEQELFRAMYWEGLGREEACSRLTARAEPVGVERIARAVAEVETSLRPWQLAEIFNANRPGGPEIALDSVEQAPDDRVDPEREEIERQRLSCLEELIGGLAPVDRLLLRLRFDEGLTLGEVAKAAGVSDSRRVHEQIARIMGALREHLSQRGWA